MCGRYTYFPCEFSDLRLTWNVDEIPDLNPRYNIAPTQESPVIVEARGKRTLELFRWGLIPWWAKDPAIGNRMINARGETLAEKPAFKHLLGRRHCLVLADSFYEWRKDGKRKVPMRFKLKSGEPFALPAFGIPGRNRMEVSCARTRLSRRSPMTCCARFIIACRLCSVTMTRSDGFPLTTKSPTHSAC